jgi:Bacterial mobilisation protein (MobC)
MNADSLIAARVPSTTKERFSLVAKRHGVSESVLLRRLIDDALVTAGEAVAVDAEPQSEQPPQKLSVRLRPEDFRLLRERAEVRKIRCSTYVALFVRAHLRNLSPLPTEELAALKRSIAELGAIGRNLNQIARAMNTGGQGDVVEVAYLQGLMKVLAGLRDHTKALVTASARSWEAGNEQKSH